MASAIRHLTIDCADAYAVADFWSQVLGQPHATTQWPHTSATAEATHP